MHTDVPCCVKYMPLTHATMPTRARPPVRPLVARRPELQEALACSPYLLSSVPPLALALYDPVRVGPCGGEKWWAVRQCCVAMQLRGHSSIL